MLSTGVPSVADACTISVGVAVNVLVAGGSAVDVAGGGAGLSDVGAYAPEVGVAYCPQSEGVDPQPLNNSATMKAGVSMRLTGDPPRKLYLRGFSPQSLEAGQFVGALSG